MRRGGSDYDSDSEASQQIGQLWRVAVKEQKTKTFHGAVELNLTRTQLGTAKKLVRLQRSGATNDPEFKPFGECTWQRMRTLLKRLIKPEAPRLWEAANRDTPLGSHEFRRLDMDNIDRHGGENTNSLVRSIGANPETMHKYYKDSRNQSYRRTQHLENMKKQAGGPSSSATGFQGSVKQLQKNSTKLC